MPIKVDPGAATFDSDIFVMRMPDFDGGLIDEPTMANITNSQAYIDDDPNWSPDGQKIVFTRHRVNDNHLNSTTAEICVLTLETGRLNATWATTAKRSGLRSGPRTVRGSRTCAGAAFKREPR